MLGFVLQLSLIAFVAGLPSSVQIHGREFADQDGRPVRFHAGELHYFRIPEAYWEDRILRVKAMGLNTVSTYVPWNWHEMTEGSLDFSSARRNVLRFLKLAKKHDLLVIIRPGPYICAEWEFGGLPAWLLKYTQKDGMELRTYDEKYLSFVDRFWGALLPIVGGQLLENGGAVAMVQLENEFGAFGNATREEDRRYLLHLRNLATKHLGENVILMTTDGVERMKTGLGNLPGVFSAVNFGPWQDPVTHVPRAFEAVRGHNKDGPELVMELWTGWFEMWDSQSWTEQRLGEPGARLAKYVEVLLQRNASFTLYMVHGGTNFGHWSSATALVKAEAHQMHQVNYRSAFLQQRAGHRPLQQRAGHRPKGKAPINGKARLLRKPPLPQFWWSTVTTSYDYAAPISEDGRHGLGSDGVDKFHAIRDLLVKYGGATPPPEPAPLRLADFGKVQLQRVSALRDPQVLEQLCDGGWHDVDKPVTMEFFDQQVGMTLYRYAPSSNLTGGGLLTLKAKDRVSVWNGDTPVVKMKMNTEHGMEMFGNPSLADNSRCTEDTAVKFKFVQALLPTGPAQQVDVLVENLGRRAYNNRMGFGRLKDIDNDWKGLQWAFMDGKPATGEWKVCALSLRGLKATKGPKILRRMFRALSGYSAPTASRQARKDEPAFFEGSFKVAEKADTYLRLDVGGWRTGSVFVNGANLGRYTTATRGHVDLYLPAPFLVIGDNQLVILEMDPSGMSGTSSITLSSKRTDRQF